MTADIINISDRLPPHPPGTRNLAKGGGGPHDPGMEARVAKLEATVEHIQTDVSDIKAGLHRLDDKMDRRFDDVRKRTWTNFYWMLGTTAGLAGLMAKGFGWM